MTQTSEPSSLSPRRSFTTSAVVGLLVLILDQITKRWAVKSLDGPCSKSDDACIDVFWTLRWHLVENSGASFSTGESLGRVFGVLALVMTVVLLKMAYEAQPVWRSVVLGAIAGGAVGNLVDRLVRAEDGFLSGSVVDFIDFQWWPIFNIADIGIVGGIIALIVLTFWSERASGAHVPTEDAAK